MYRPLTDEELAIASDPVIEYMKSEDLEKNIKTVRKAMEKAAKELNFMEAARLRDELFALEKSRK